jgi:hypothetical protein
MAVNRTESRRPSQPRPVSGLSRYPVVRTLMEDEVPVRHRRERERGKRQDVGSGQGREGFAGAVGPFAGDVGVAVLVLDLVRGSSAR